MERESRELDRFGRLLMDRGAWRQAVTLAAAGELTARWLEGRSQYQPATYTARYDAETESIAKPLAQLNRSGLFTKESQPGQVANAGNAQREYVTAYCAGPEASTLLTLSTHSDLITVAHAPGEACSSSIPVTVRNNEIVTVLGSSESPSDTDQVQDWADETNESLALVLADCWYVEVFDPVWGRTGQLFPAVLAVLAAA
jgi:hypothetical protein